MSLADHFGSTFARLAALEQREGRARASKAAPDELSCLTESIAGGIGPPVPPPPEAVSEPRSRPRRQAPLRMAAPCACGAGDCEPCEAEIDDVEDECLPVLEDSDSERTAPVQGPAAKMAARRRAIRASKDQAARKPPLRPSWHETVAAEALSFLGDSVEINDLEDAEEPEFIEIDMTVDTGAMNSVLSREDVPTHEVLPSEGSRAGQQFQSAAAGGKLIDNEGEVQLDMIAPAEGESLTELTSTFQVAKVTRPLLSVTKVCDRGNFDVLCRREAAYVLDDKQKVIAKFPRRGGLYVATVKVRNPRWRGFAGQGQ